jgi:hypothetical protein
VVAAEGLEHEGEGMVGGLEEERIVVTANGSIESGET